MKNSNIIKRTGRELRKNRVRAKIRGTSDRPRLAVFRSLKHISAQLIDDVAGRTLVEARDAEVEKNLKGIVAAEAVGKKLAEKAVAKKITNAVFDRAGYKYHGQVKALADGARSAGMNI
ncbi:MAG: 50S ribosomal protein L18 [bacterium]|nr:50S ribosomal protein L18 [bacterium]